MVCESIGYQLSNIYVILVSFDVFHFHEKLCTHKYFNYYFHEQREHMKKQLEKTKNQKEKLESLCRSLQAERKQNPNGQSNADPTPV